QCRTLREKRALPARRRASRPSPSPRTGGARRFAPWPRSPCGPRSPCARARSPRAGSEDDAPCSCSRCPWSIKGRTASTTKDEVRVVEAVAVHVAHAGDPLAEPHGAVHAGADGPPRLVAAEDRLRGGLGRPVGPAQVGLHLEHLVHWEREAWG